MHGHGYGPQVPSAPSGGSPVTMRVLFVVLAVVTCGFLAWTAMLRLALVTRRTRDWVLFALVVALEVTAVVLIGIDPGDDEFTGPGNTGMTILVSTLVPVIAYYLTMDIRHCARAAHAARFHDPYQQTRPGHMPRQPQHLQHPQPSYGYPAQHMPAPAPAPPIRPAPARIDQVRAELDELSDYLRKQEGGN